MGIFNRSRKVEEDIDLPDSKVERLTDASLEKANKVITSIENAQAIWEMSKKPEQNKREMEKLGEMHGKISFWIKNMVQARDKKEKIRLLKRFSLLFKKTDS